MCISCESQEQTAPTFEIGIHHTWSYYRGALHTTKWLKEQSKNGEEMIEASLTRGRFLAHYIYVYERTRLRERR